MAGVYAVIVAAGRGARMGAAVNKVLLPLRGKPVLRRTAEAFVGCPGVDGAVVVAAREELGDVRRALDGMPGIVGVVPGGDVRQRSVRNGLAALPADARIVLVQDGARPFTSQRLIQDCIAAVEQFGSAVACSRVTDTIKTAQDGVIRGTIDRDSLRAVQTPQCFFADELRRAYEKAEADGILVTDDASVMEHAGARVHLVESAECNLKLTTPQDMALAQALLGEREGMERLPATGFGYDVHRLVPGRRLVLCGVEIPYELGLDGHSDADVAVHALMDALLGAAGLGDIGRLYPDNDPQYAGIDSMLLLRDVVRRLSGYRIVHADVTIVCQKPKLKDYMPRMVESLQAALPGARINVKATTTEKLGFEGRGEGISAQAVATIW